MYARHCKIEHFLTLKYVRSIYSAKKTRARGEKKAGKRCKFTKLTSERINTHSELKIKVDAEEKNMDRFITDVS